MSKAWKDFTDARSRLIREEVANGHTMREILITVNVLDEEHLARIMTESFPPEDTTPVYTIMKLERQVRDLETSLNAEAEDRATANREAAKERRENGCMHRLSLLAAEKLMEVERRCEDLIREHDQAVNKHDELLVVKDHLARRVEELEGQKVTT